MPFNNRSRWPDGAASRLIVIQAYLRKNLVESEFEDVAIAFNYKMQQPTTKRTAKMCRDKWDQIGSGHSTGHSSRSPEQMDVEKINQIRDEEKQTKSPLTTEQLASLKEIVMRRKDEAGILHPRFDEIKSLFTENDVEDADQIGSNQEDDEDVETKTTTTTTTGRGPNWDEWEVKALMSAVDKEPQAEPSMWTPGDEKYKFFNKLKEKYGNALISSIKKIKAKLTKANENRIKKIRAAIKFQRTPKALQRKYKDVVTGTGAVKNDDAAVEEYRQKISSIANVLQVKGVEAVPTKALGPRNSSGGDKKTTPRASSSDEIGILDDTTNENVKAAVKTKKKRKRKEDHVAAVSANLSRVLKKRDVQTEMMTMEAKMKFVRIRETEF